MLHQGNLYLQQKENTTENHTQSKCGCGALCQRIHLQNRPPKVQGALKKRGKKETEDL